MKANLLTVDPEMESKLGECAVGETKQMMVTVKVTGKDEEGLSAEITDVEPYAEEEYEEPAPTKSPALAKALMGEE
jgi:hypothetical protein